MDTSHLEKLNNLDMRKKILQRVFMGILVLNIFATIFIFYFLWLWRYLYENFSLYYKGEITHGVYTGKYEDKSWTDSKGKFYPRYEVGVEGKCDNKNFNKVIVQKNPPKDGSLYDVLCWWENDDKILLSEKESLDIVVLYAITIMLSLYIFWWNLYLIHVIRHPEKLVKHP